MRRRTPTRGLLRVRRGFTLTELIIITIIISVLATIAVSMFDRVRLDGQIAGAKTEVRNVITAIERFYTVRGVYPASLEELEAGDFHQPSDKVDFCTFELQAESPPWVLLEAAHKGASVHVRARYPLTGAQMEEVAADADCSA